MKKNLLVLGISTVLSALCAPAIAQTGAAPSDGTDTAPEQTARTLDAVSVTGIRRANQAAIESKRAAANITDVVSATDARALPDLTIVEALRRVPGLSVLPAVDNEHPRDEASTPVIRGLGSSYNNVTIDGLTVASPGTPNGNLGSVTRGVRLDILPSSMISEIGVIKTFTADLDPNAVGGAIDLKTRSAFENGGKPFFTAEASLGHANDNGEPTSQSDPGYRISGTGSRTFGSEGQFGLVVSGNYQTLDSFTYTHMTTDTVHYNFYDAAGQRLTGNDLGNGFPVPQQDKSWYVQDNRDRYGVTAKLEARPSSSFDAFLMGGYYYFKDDMTRHENIIDARNAPVSDQTATSGTYAGGDLEVGYSNQQITTKTKVAQTGFNWYPSQRQAISVRGSYSKATYDEPIKMIKYATGVVRSAPGTGGATPSAQSQYGFTYDTSGFNQVFPVDPAAYYDMSQYSLVYWRPDYNRNAQDAIKTGRADYRFNLGEMDRGFGFGAGTSYTDDRPSYSVHRTEYAPNTTAPPLTLADAVGSTDASLPYSRGLTLITIDPAKAAQLLEGMDKSQFNLTDQSAFNNQDNFQHHEQIFGAYALGSYTTEDYFVQAGVRYDSTDIDTVGNLRNSAGAWVRNPTSSSYARYLPSVLGRMHLTDQVDLRAGYSQTIGRPPYDSYAARSSISFVNASDQGNPDATGVSVNIGNPQIKPRLSNNFDLALDWQIPGQTGGLLSVALFDKQIEDEIYTRSTLGYTDGFSGVTYRNAVVNTPQNASDARVRGVELSGVANSFASLSPLLAYFGASANVSLLQGKLQVPMANGVSRGIDNLVGQPDYVLNATVFYARDGLELRAAYNKQGRALRSIVSDTPWQDLYWQARSQIDLSATYQMRHGLALIGQVSNVGHSKMTTVTGPGKNLLKDSYSIPTTYWLGVRYTPSN